MRDFADAPGKPPAKTTLIYLDRRNFGAVCPAKTGIRFHETAAFARLPRVAGPRGLIAGYRCQRTPRWRGSVAVESSPRHNSRGHAADAGFVKRTVCDARWLLLIHEPIVLTLRFSCE